MPSPNPEEPLEAIPSNDSEQVLPTEELKEEETPETLDNEGYPVGNIEDQIPGTPRRIPSKPSKLELPETYGLDDSSYTPSPGTSTQMSPSYLDSEVPTPLTPDFLLDEPDGDELTPCDTPIKEGETRPKSFSKHIHDASKSRPSSSSKKSRGGFTSSAENSPCFKRKCSKCAEENNKPQKRKGLKFPSRFGKKENGCKGSESHCKKGKEHEADESSPMCSEVKGLNEKLKDIPGSPHRINRQNNKSKQEQLHARHLEKRAQHDVGHKRLAKHEHDLKVKADADISDEEKSGQNDQDHHHHHHHHHHHQRSSKHRSSQRRSSHRSRSSSVNSRASFGRVSDQEDGEDDDPRAFNVPNRWLSYDVLSQKSDCERNGSTSMINLEYPYKPANSSGIYISPYFSSAYQAPGAEVLIASLIMIFGVAALITHYATGIHVWLIVGAVCLVLGACFMLMGLCWYCRHSSQNKEDEEIRKRVKRFKAKLKLERSPSAYSQSMEDLTEDKKEPEVV